MKSVGFEHSKTAPGTVQGEHSGDAGTGATSELNREWETGSTEWERAQEGRRLTFEHLEFLHDNQRDFSQLNREQKLQSQLKKKL